MVEERIFLNDFVWIILSPRETSIGLLFKWMLSIDGVGSCGAAISRNMAIKKILKSERLSEKLQKELEVIFKERKIERFDQLELF